MAKTIKFNLTLDGEPVRDIVGLQEHFSIEDILEYFKSGLLLRWLEVRGYDKEKEQVEGIHSSSPREIITKLIQIFNIESDSATIERSITILEYEEERIVRKARHSEEDVKTEDIIEAYHEGYEKLIENIEAHRNDIQAIKVDVGELEKHYFNLFQLSYKMIFDRLILSAPKAIYVILTRDRLREYWMNDNDIQEQLRLDISPMGMINKTLQKDLKKIVCRQSTQQWVPIEPEHVKVMVLRAEGHIYVKGFQSEDPLENYGLGGNINGKYPVLDGLKYRSMGESVLLYMEV